MGEWQQASQNKDKDELKKLKKNMFTTITNGVIEDARDHKCEDFSEMRLPDACVRGNIRWNIMGWSAINYAQDSRGGKWKLTTKEKTGATIAALRPKGSDGRPMCGQTLSWNFVNELRD